MGGGTGKTIGREVAGYGGLENRNARKNSHKMQHIWHSLPRVIHFGGVA